MAAFVKRGSDGSSGGFLECPDEWAKNLRSRTEIPGHMLKMLSTLDLDSMPEVVYSLVKAAMRSPPKYCHARVITSKFLNCTDVGNLIKDKRAQLIDLVAKVRSSDDWFTKDLAKAGVHVSRSAFIRVQGGMDVDSVMDLMKKSVPNKAAHTSLE